MELDKLAKSVKKCLESKKCFEYYLKKSKRLDYPLKNKLLIKYYYSFLEEIENDFYLFDYLENDCFILFLNYLYKNNYMPFLINYELFKEEFGIIMYKNIFKVNNLNTNLLILKPLIKKLKSHPEKLI